MTTTLKTKNHAAFSLTYHVIFTVKYRHPVITAAMLESLQNVFARTCKKWSCTLQECSGEKDHIHLLIDAHPSLNLARMIGNLKTVSARRIRQEFKTHLAHYYWRGIFWNGAYAVVSAGGHANIEQLIDYIRDQEQPPA